MIEEQFIEYNIQNCHFVIQKVVDEIQNLPTEELSFHVYDVQNSRKKIFQDCIEKECQSLPKHDHDRVLAEFEGLGPIESLVKDDEITEILINGSDIIWYEKNGALQRHQDYFSTKFTYQHFVHRLCQNANTHFTLDKPMTDGKILNFRLHLISEELTKSEVTISLRRHPENPWTFEKLQAANYMTQQQTETLKEMIQNKENFLIVGGTGSGKTSLLNACLQATREHERSVIIEDTSEITKPNQVSCKLLTRKDAQGALKEIDQAELVKQSLRMRPDRLIMGEVRGQEAKDLLMALSTGHAGSFATLHATDARQALIRLEMLIQLGAPYWSLDAIRNLIFLSLQKIVVVQRNQKGQRELTGIYQISSRESSGILVDQLA